MREGFHRPLVRWHLRNPLRLKRIAKCQGGRMGEYLPYLRSEDDLDIRVEDDRLVLFLYLHGDGTGLGTTVPLVSLARFPGCASPGCWPGPCSDRFAWRMTQCPSVPNIQIRRPCTSARAAASLSVSFAGRSSGTTFSYALSASCSWRMSSISSDGPGFAWASEQERATSALQADGMTCLPWHPSESAYWEGCRFSLSPQAATWGWTKEASHPPWDGQSLSSTRMQRDATCIWRL